uniref:Uncharacterized protein n=1 Tax=Vitis vinifera TaxID=29760 RepID=A5APV3_VITVI|nr:hypothetical protein VITISV_040081 [Vitis vinifera]
MGSCTFHPGRNSIRLPPHSTRLPPHSTRMSHIRNSAPPTFHPVTLHLALDAGWERKAFQLPWSDIFGSADSAHPEDFAANFAQCRGFLLKLPDMCDRHL